MTTMAKDDLIEIIRIETGLFVTNAYIIICRETRQSVLVDAPGEASRMIDQLKETIPKYILITHSHMDHTGALNELKSRLKVPVAAHPSDAGRLPLACDKFLNDGDIISFGRVKLKVLHTPGHTPGSLCFLTGNFLLSGDTLFPHGPGKTNTPADLKQIIISLEQKIFILPDEVLVFPGHGESTVLKREKEEFAVFSSRPHPPHLCGDVLWLES